MAISSNFSYQSQLTSLIRTELQGEILYPTRRWQTESRIDFLTRHNEEPPPSDAVPAICTVANCGRGVQGHGLCQDHYMKWRNAGRPTSTDWLSASDRPRTSVCAVATCPLLTDSLDKHLCRTHLYRWWRAGRPDDLHAWSVDIAQRPCIRLTPLPTLLRLEIAFGLQRWGDEGNQKLRPSAVRRAVVLLANTGITSLVEVDLVDWTAWWSTVPGVRKSDSRVKQFLRQTRRSLETVRYDVQQAWLLQFPRDRWDLQALNVASETRNWLDFSSIRITWLQQIAKQWSRWRLRRGLKASTVAYSLRGIASLSNNIERRDGIHAGPEVLDRARLEVWLTDIALELVDRHQQRRVFISHVGQLLRDNLLHEWAPELPRSARIDRDLPTTRRPEPRAISEYVLRQLDTPTALARFPSEDGRLLVRLGLGCGLRIGDVRQLPFDCVVQDTEGHPCLAWLNRKSRDQPGYFPLAEDLALDIARQQEAVRSRFPAGSPWLFPASANNLTGSKPMRAGRFQRQLGCWLDDLAITDEHGQGVRITYHQFRHTLATRLLNRDVPLTVVQDLLGHASPQTTITYARYNAATLRRHWHRAVAAPGAPVSMHAYSDRLDGARRAASGTHAGGSAFLGGRVPEELASASITLSNGRCGAPVHTTCEFANPCLRCRFFVTDPSFQDQHQRQRDATAQAIDAGRRAGLTRATEDNNRTLVALDDVLQSLRSGSAGPPQEDS